MFTMDLKSKVLLYCVVFFVLLSLGITIYKTLFLHDFEIEHTSGEDLDTSV